MCYHSGILAQAKWCAGKVCMAEATTTVVIPTQVGTQVTLHFLSAGGWSLRFPACAGMTLSLGVRWESTVQVHNTGAFGL